MMDKNKIKQVLQNEATEQDAMEVAGYFGSAEGQLQVSELLETDMEAMVPYFRTRVLRVRAANKVNRWWRVAAVVLVVMVVGGVTGVVMSKVRPAVMQTVCASRGEQVQVVLQDGTHIYLNAGSRLVFPSRFTTANREVTLVGEAYFEVEKEKHRPFLVNLNGVSVEVLGTQFNVTAYENEPLQVNLDEGHVLFHGAKQSVDMKAGERLCYDRKTCCSTLFHNADTHMASAWKEHRLAVRDMPMEELLSILERRYDVTINVRDAQCYAYTYSLVVSDMNMNTILKYMSSVSPIRYRYDEEAKNVLVYARK